MMMARSYSQGTFAQTFWDSPHNKCLNWRSSIHEKIWSNRSQSNR